MKRRKLKAFVVPMMYVMSIGMLVASVYAIEKLVDNALLKDSIKEDSESVDDVIYNNDYYYDYGDIPVINTDVVISRPYSNGSVSVVKDYYDYKAEASRQEDSILYYGNTYMQNSGIDYGMGSEFEVVSILDGVVTEVVDDEILGKMIKIKHNNDLISVYQSLGNIDVKVDEEVVQGAIIGTSGEANISPELGNHLHFELYYKGSVVNPSDYYDKLVSELE